MIRKKRLHEASGVDFVVKKFNVLIVGGGSTWTPGLLKAMCVRKETFPIQRLVLYDIDARRQKAIGEFAKILFQEEYPEAQIHYTTKKEEAFTEELDFVFVQIRTGGFTMREQDEKIPLRIGVIGQETCGAGRFRLRHAIHPGHGATGQRCACQMQGCLDPELYQSGSHCGRGPARNLPR